MVRHERFFDDNKKAAAVLKHAVLRRYLSAFVFKLSSTSPGKRVGYIDGYAGPGSYVNTRTGVISAGSPKIALDIATDARSKGRRLECIFIEKNAAIYNRLSALVDDSKTPDVTALAWQGDVSTHLPRAMESMSNVPTLVFLDPFGAPVDIDHTVNTILRRPGTAPTELLLNFSLDALRRIGGRVLEPEGAHGREKTLARADDWLGGTWWREFFLSTANTDESGRIDTAALAVAYEYNKRIMAATGCSSFSIPIRRRAHHKPIFLLTLFHPRRLAAYAYNEAVSMALAEWREIMNQLDVDDAAKDSAGDDFQLGSVSPREVQRALEAAEEQFQIDVVVDIKESIRAQLRNRSKLSIEHDLQLVMGKGIGAGRGKHLRKAWNELYKDGFLATPPPTHMNKAELIRKQLPSFT